MTTRGGNDEVSVNGKLDDVIGSMPWAQVSRINNV